MVAWRKDQKLKALYVNYIDDNHQKQQTIILEKYVCDFIMVLLRRAKTAYKLTSKILSPHYTVITISASNQCFQPDNAKTQKQNNYL